LANNENKKRRQENSIKNPGAAVVIFNYKHRLGTAGLSLDEAHEIDQLILNTVSLRKVSTSKSKSQPEGRFEIHLAPTKNWVQSITPGSWCVILMSQDKIFPDDTKWNTPKAKLNKLKMVGRIESVRAVTAVDQATGAITTEYVVQGEDWGGILNTHLYVDPLIRGQADQRNPIGAAERYIYNEKLISFGKGDVPLPTSSENIKALLAFWGRTTEAKSSIKETFLSTGRLAEAKNQFKLPKELASFLDLPDASNREGVAFADVINVVSGKLTGPDNADDETGSSYEEIDDGAAPIMLDSILGSHSFWQLIINNSNHWINDTYADLRWEFDSRPSVRASRPKFTIYNRVKPFSLNVSNTLLAQANDDGANSFSPKKLEDFISEFKNIRVHEIDRGDLLLVNAGTNWRDRFNFIEVNVGSGMLAGAADNKNYSAETKLRNQTFDEVAIGRDGFKPMIVNAKYIPKDPASNKLDPFRVLEYKTMNREWFFNIHRMLNGSMTLVGQSNYIAVGDNILIDADAIFTGRNANKDHIENRNRAYLLAHVEAISHTCSVSETGARNFVTEIQFVRGIITDQNGNELDNDVLLDENTNELTPKQELNSNRVFGTSSGKNGQADPDVQKLKGK
jgi:hypothetical protein